VDAIAIIGLSGRFPGANSVDEFWRNLREGVESIRLLSAEALFRAGVDAAVLDDPNYVKAAAPIAGPDLFDAEFFGISPREAEIMDPQQRLFLEAAWEALENSGYQSEPDVGRIGVFAGSSINTYLLNNLLPNRDRLEAAGGLQSILYNNDKDYLATRVSYKLNLKGPSLNVQTACSTSLVAVALACESLINYQCDMALAGGVTIRVPQETGYLYQEGGIVSPDGHCRAFDAAAAGTIFGNGVGVVTLKRLEEAESDGDEILAVIRGWALNNDGAEKVGFTAPGVSGQAEVIAEALARAGVSADTIGYVEAHGTGTPLGDPVEIAALTQAFRSGTDRIGYCALGTAKSNVGHLNAAAGVTGLIKAALSLHHKELVPTLNVQRANPAMNLDKSPFRLSIARAEWKTTGHLRRAGVSSFGIGGTNAHVVLEEAPPSVSSGPARSAAMLTLSARSAAALQTATRKLATHLKASPDVPLADVAYTLHLGRKVFPHRRVVVAASTEEAAERLEQLDSRHVLTSTLATGAKTTVFMFPGQGTQYVGMGRGLYEEAPNFRGHIDRCAELLLPTWGQDLRALLYPPHHKVEVSEGLHQTELAQVALFTVEYALAQVLMSFGVTPGALIGHSVGEYVAACLAGVLSLPDALRLVAARGRLMQKMSPGAMVSVLLSEQQLAPLLGSELSLAAANAPNMSVVAGAVQDITHLEAELTARGVQYRVLKTSHAFHSVLTEPILDAFENEVRQVKLATPMIPVISNLTGNWLTPSDATDPKYWRRHLRRTVRFHEGLDTLLADPHRVFVEVGPGNSLGTFLRQHGGRERIPDAVTTIRHPQESHPDFAFLLQALGQLWLAGAEVCWKNLYTEECRHRVPLPTYPFEGKSYWISPRPSGNSVASSGDPPRPLTAEHLRPELSQAFVAPSNPVEQTLAGIWQAMLGIEQIGVHDNFFQLGGHSLLATQMLSRIREKFPVEISLESVFVDPTVAGLSEAIEELLISKLEQMPDEVA
jgi:phthiocerol/phenolphthiocerol synthesis type-I polyketide synthase E